MSTARSPSSVLQLLRDVAVAVALIASLGGLGRWTAPSVRPPPPPGVEAPTVREIALASLDDLQLRQEAIRVLGFVGHEEDLPVLRQLVADPRWATPAAHALIDLLGPDALPHLEPLIRNRWFAGRGDLIRALGHAADPRSAELLIELYTTSRTGWVVHAAGNALAERQEPRAIEPFVADFWRTRRRAYRLAAFPPESPAREALREAAGSDRLPHATYAMTALAEAADAEVVPLLIEQSRARSLDRRVTALDALGESDDPRALAAILAFEVKIDSNEEFLEWMSALWASDNSEAHARALDALSTRPAGLAQAAAWHLPDDILRRMTGEFTALVERRPGVVGDTIAAQLMSVEWHEVTEPLLVMARDRLAGHRGWQDPGGPTDILWRFGTAKDRERIAAMMSHAAESGDGGVLGIFHAIPAHQRTDEHVEAVVLLLSYTSERATVARAFDALAPHLDEARRAEIALALLDRVPMDSVMRRAMAVPQGEAHVAELARSGTRSEQAAARAATGEGTLTVARTFDSEPLQTFDDQVRGLQSSDLGTTSTAAFALAESSDPRALALLEETVMAGGPKAAAAGHALQMGHPGRTRSLVDDLFADPDPERRVLALNMGFIADSELPFDALSDESAVVREQAIDLLGANGSSRAAVALRELLDDEDPGVQEAAAVALEKLGGRHAREAGERIAELLP